jgi:hypothetical protein
MRRWSDNEILEWLCIRIWIRSAWVIVRIGEAIHGTSEARWDVVRRYFDQSDGLEPLGVRYRLLFAVAWTFTSLVADPFERFARWILPFPDDE